MNASRMLCRRMARSAGLESSGSTSDSGIGSMNSAAGRVLSSSRTVPTGPSSIGRTRRARSASASRHTRVAMLYSQVFTDERCSKRSRLRQARTSVSCTASSASSGEPSIR